MKKNSQSSFKMLMSSAFMFSLSIILFIGVTFAWFAIGAKVGELDMIAADPRVYANLYYFDGNTWIKSNPQDKDPGSFYFEDVLPNQVFYYKLELYNSGTVDSDLKVEFQGITCPNESEEIECLSKRMQIKNLSLYNATYENDTFTQGDLIEHTFDVSDKYLIQNDNGSINVLTYTPFNKQDALILYFYLWFNPTQAYDLSNSEIVDEENSNKYIKSNLKITNIFVTIEQIKDTIPDWENLDEG